MRCCDPASTTPARAGAPRRGRGCGCSRGSRCRPGRASRCRTPRSSSRCPAATCSTSGIRCVSTTRFSPDPAYAPATLKYRRLVAREPVRDRVRGDRMVDRKLRRAVRIGRTGRIVLGDRRVLRLAVASPRSRRTPVAACPRPASPRAVSSVLTTLPCQYSCRRHARTRRQATAPRNAARRRSRRSASNRPRRLRDVALDELAPRAVPRRRCRWTGRRRRRPRVRARAAPVRRRCRRSRHRR